MRKTTKTKAAAVLLALAMALSLTACGHEHTWTDATCTAPKTCSECGATEGEALGHSWADATCAAPKTCSVCKETEGEALPHTWEEATCAAPKTCSVCGETDGEALPHTLTEANFQSPAVCTVCGAEVGERLKASYEEHPFPLMEQGVTYDSLVAGASSNDTEVTAHVTLSDVYRFDSDETYPATEGYEYIHADIDLEVYGDKLIEYNGFYYNYLYGDYYYDTAEDVDENGEIARDGFDENGNIDFSVNFNGVDWEDCLAHWEQSNPVWDIGAKTSNMTMTFTIRVPVGYDGAYIGVLHPRYVEDVSTAIYLADVYQDGYFVVFRIE